MKFMTFTLLSITVLFGLYGLLHLFGASAPLIIFVTLALFCIFFGWLLPRILKRTNVKVWIFLGLLCLIGLMIPSSSLMADREPGPVSDAIWFTLFLLPSLALVSAAFLLYAGWGGTVPESDKISKGISLPLSILLIVKTIYNLYDLTLWDNTYDPLGYLWLILPIFAVLLSGLMLAVALPGKIKLVGSAYSILVSVSLIGVSTLAQRVDFRQETTGRAERIVAAIDSYYTREGRYPESLSLLTPRYILSLPKPMIMHGQDWCYDSGDGYYRLGYLDREHWSSPHLIGRTYKSVGEVSDPQPICMDAFLAMQSRIPDYPYTYLTDGE